MFVHVRVNVNFSKLIYFCVDLQCMFYVIFVVFVLEVNPCMSSPCQNGGYCMNHQTYYTCDCQTGWTGELCNGKYENIKICI